VEQLCSEPESVNVGRTVLFVSHSFGRDRPTIAYGACNEKSHEIPDASQSCLLDRKI